MYNSSFPILQNAALLLGLAVLCDTVSPLKAKFHRFVVGLIVGLIGVLVMLVPWQYGPGIVFDARSVVLAISGLYLGPLPTIIAMVITIVMRISLGGEAMLMGVVVIITSGAIGLAWRRFRNRQLKDMTWSELYAMGLLIHALMLLTAVVTLESRTWMPMLTEITVPVMLIHPAATVALGLLMTNHLRRDWAIQQLRESEAELKATLYGIGDGVISTDSQCRITRMNATAELLTGWTEAEARGRHLNEIFDVISETSRRPVRTPCHEVLNYGRHIGPTNHTLLISRDGTERPIAENASPIFDTDGRTIGVVLVFRDQSAQRASSKALRESEERFRTIFEQAPMGVVEVEAPTGTHLNVNDRYCEILGYTPQQLRGRSYLDVLHPEDAQRMRGIGLRTLVSKKGELPIEVRAIRKDGSIRWIKGVVTTFWGGGKERTRMVAMIQDVTDQTLAKQALEESQRRLATLMENLPGMAYRCALKPNWPMEFVSAGASRLTGYPAEMLLKGDGIHYGELLLPEDAPRVWETVSDAVSQYRSFKVNYRIRTANGEIRWVEERGVGVHSPVTREVVAVEGFIIDVTEQRLAQEALEEAERFYRSTIDALPTQIAVLDGSGNIIAANAAWRQFAARNLVAGRDIQGDVTGMNYMQICASMTGELANIGTDLANGIRTVLLGEAQRDYVQEYPFGDRWFVTRVTRFPDPGPLRVVVHHIDVTERKHAERALAESEKRFRAMVERLPDAILIDVQDRIAYANPAAVEILGAREVSDLLGRSIYDFIEPGYHADVSRRRQLLMANPQSAMPLEEEKAVRCDGTVVDIEVSAAPFEFARMSGMLLYIRDITLRKRAQRELARVADFSVSLLRQAPALIWRSGVDMKCNWFNDTWLSFTGRKLEQELGDGWTEGIHPEDRSRCLSTYSDGFKARKPFFVEYRLRRSDGEWRWMADYGMPFDDLDGQFAGYISYCFDITERIQAEERVREMATELSLTEERERRRLAENLHDDVCQILALVQIKLSVARQDEEHRRELMSESERLIDRANRALRSLMMRMSHPAIYELGFSAGAEWLIEDMYTLYGLTVTLEDDKSFEGMDIRVRVLLFQCLRELLVNVAKHSGVNQAHVRLLSHNGEFRVEVEDHGRGVELDKLGKHSECGFGLFAIRERLHNLRGHIEIRSAPGAGALVVLSVPSQNKQDGTSTNSLS